MVDAFLKILTASGGCESASRLARFGMGRLGVAAYRSALSQQLLYPLRGEVEEAVKRLQPIVRKDYRA